MATFAAAVRSTGLNPESVLLVYTVESGLDPHASSGAAWGLNQAQGAILRSVGWDRDPAAFGELGVIEQAPWLAKMLRAQIQAVGADRIRTALDLYLMNFSPAAARSGREVIFARDKPDERRAYEANKGLDVDGDGQITREDVKRVLDRANGSARYRAALEQLNRLRAAGGLAA